jgi:hypothetical protein
MFKDVMVLLDGADEDEVRLAHAESIAARFAAHLTGLCISPIPEYGLAFAGEPGFVAADTVIPLEERARTEAERVLARLKDRFARIDVPNEVRNIVEFPAMRRNGRPRKRAGRIWSSPLRRTANHLPATAHLKRSCLEPGTASTSFRPKAG